MRRLAVTVALVATACGGPRDERSVSASAVPHAAPGDVIFARSLDASCASYANARCADFVLCASFVDRAHFRDEAECVARVTRTCIDEGNVPGVVGAIERADGCAIKLRGLECNDRRDPDTQHRACTVPGLPPRGALIDGSPCVDGAQCTGGACRHEPGKRCGVCASAPAVFAACESSADCGGNELYCAAHTCAPLRDVDAACAGDDECRVGLSCITGRCAIGTMGEGEVCIPGSNACDPREGLRCIGEEWTRCVAFEVVEPAGSCVGGAMGLPVLCAGEDAYCRASDWRCVSPTAVGSPCSADDECGPLHACVQLDDRAMCLPASEVCR